MDQSGKIVFLSVFTLIMIGVVMIYSSSGVYAYSMLGDSLYFVKRHLFFLLIGVVAAVFCMIIPVKFIEDNARFIMLAALMLLVLVLMPGIGTQAGGARRWIRLLGFGIQPSEMAKLALIIYIADFTSRKRFIMSRFFQGFLPAMTVIGITSVLIILEPDLGTTVAIGFIGMVMLFVSGANLKHLAVVAVSAVPVLWLAIISAPYRMKRIIAFLSPWADPKGAGFQLIQSFIALGSGGIFGLGLGASKQKLFYLPQSHTDFIYSIIGEELGFVGATFVLLIFTLLIWHSLRISLKLKNPFSSRVVLGISLMIAFETIVNIGVSSGAVPTKGLPLPFISYGGSSLVVHLAAVGLLLNIARQVE